MGLSELGAFLQRHREERGLSLADIEAVTRIRRVHLEAMESGDWDSLPPGVYIRGLLKSYARAVGISQASVMRMYAKERPKEARLPEPQLISQPLLNEPRFSLDALLAVLTFAVAAVIMGWLIKTYFLPEIERAGDRSGTSVAQVDGTSESSSDIPVEPASTRGPTATERPTLPPASSATPRATASPTPVDGLRIEVQAKGNIWLRISADQETVFEGFLREGENDRWSGESKQRFRLRTGDAGRTEVTLNGQRLEPLGDNAEVREVEWRLLPSGEIEQSG